ncbi:hypothetical protein [Lewinella sp. IMCC34183]|uniref:hypothetical protein n=1 Tax=Lewinella sp. IMCC34183 TaxID=2248762 RepID=UPI000E27B300|nr:hypothetical protein [Lewinella sp. IMCC34183]
MKSSLVFLLLLAAPLLLWTSCEKDDPAVATTLNYDGDPVSAPQLPPGKNMFAAYFPPSVTQQYTGRTLERIRFYLNTIPDSTAVVVYGEGPDDRTPGAELYRQPMTNRITTNRWIEDRVIPGLEIDGQGLWLAVEVVLPDGEPFSVGCDAGRTYNSNGDLLRLATNPNQWASFRDITGEQVNWNIRGILGGE